MFSMYGSRYVCNVLSEMRAYIKTIEMERVHRRHIRSLVEEIQSMVNRMESAIEDYKGDEFLEDRLTSMHEEKKKLRKQIAKLRAKKGKLDDELKTK